MPSLASVATSHMGHLVPPGRIGSPGMGGGTPFNRSMSALDLGPSALVGERVRAGRGKAATSYDFEGKVRGALRTRMPTHTHTHTHTHKRLRTHACTHVRM
eukprot:989472-Pelagomonas_calceolata.AAC.2